MVEKFVFAHVRAEDETQIAVAPVDGRFRVHDVESIVEEQGQKRGLDGELIAPAEVPVVEHLEEPLFDKIAQGFRVGVGVEAIRRRPPRLSVLVLRHQGIVQALGVEAAHYQVRDGQAQSALLVAPAQGKHPQVVEKRGQKGVVSGGVQHILDSEAIGRSVDADSLVRVGLIGGQGLRDQPLAVRQPHDEVNPVAIHGQVAV